MCVCGCTCVGKRKGSESLKVSVFAVTANFSIVSYSIFIYVCHVVVAVCV